MLQRSLTFQSAQNIWRGADRAETAQSSIQNHPQGAAGAQHSPWLLWQEQEQGGKCRMCPQSGFRCQSKQRLWVTAAAALPSSSPDPQGLLGNAQGCFPGSHPRCQCCTRWDDSGFCSLLASRQELSALLASSLLARVLWFLPCPRLLAGLGGLNGYSWSPRVNSGTWNSGLCLRSGAETLQHLSLSGII